MSRTLISPALQAHIAGGSLTIAWYWILLRSDHLVRGYTTHVEDIAIGSLFGIDVPTMIGFPPGAVACTAQSGFELTDVQMGDSLAQNNLDVTSALGPDGINEEDVRAGKWRDARVEIGYFNYTDLSQGTAPIFVGSLGSITFGDLTAKAELRGLTQPLEEMMDGITSENCDAKVFDARCGVDPQPYKRSGVVAGWSGDRLFVDPARTEPDGWWTKGELIFRSGAMNGLAIEVKRSLQDGTIELVEEVYPGFANNDLYDILPGCNKLLWLGDGSCGGDCKVKYDNAPRFRGFKTPGPTAINQYGGQGAGT